MKACYYGNERLLLARAEISAKFAKKMSVELLKCLQTAVRVDGEGTEGNEVEALGRLKWQHREGPKWQLFSQSASASFA